jgi:glycosyltransferase involved in cell wall biosynthesis
VTPRPHLVIVGDGPLREEIQREASRLGVDGDTTILGARPQSELFSLMSASDLVIQPSLHEGFGLAVLEAMALGCAVIASRVGGLPEIVEDGVSGILISPSNDRELADSVAALVGDAGRLERLRAAARARAVKAFAPERVAALWDGFYSQLDLRAVR